MPLNGKMVLKLVGSRLLGYQTTRVLACADRVGLQDDAEGNSVALHGDGGNAEIGIGQGEGPLGKDDRIRDIPRWRPGDKRRGRGGTRPFKIGVVNPGGVGGGVGPLRGHVPAGHDLGLGIEDPAAMTHLRVVRSVIPNVAGDRIGAVEAESEIGTIGGRGAGSRVATPVGRYSNVHESHCWPTS